MLYILVVFLVLTLILLSAGYYFYRIAFFPKVYKTEEVLRMEIENERLSKEEFASIQSWAQEEIIIPSPFGYHLYCRYFPFPATTSTVVFSHGITVSLEASYKYIHLFRKHNFNILVYDNRYHGRSGGNACSFGYFEKHDLKAVIDWVFERNGPAAVVGTHGESLGAAITLQHAAIDPRIRFAIPDCPFSDLDQLFRIRLREDYHLPPFPLLQICAIYTRRLLGFNYRLSSPIAGLDSIETPIFFIHGDQDKYIPPAMSQAMYNRKHLGRREIYLAKDAGHAEALIKNRQEYQRRIDAFLDSIGCIIN